MTDETQSDVRWAPMEPKPSKRGRVWVIVGLVVAALVIVGVLLFAFLPRGAAPAPEQSATPSPSASATSTRAPEPSDSPDPSMTPVTTPPPPVDPTVEAFRGQVGFWLEDAARGLDIVAQSESSDATAVVQSLREDAQRLSDAQPPSSIASDWQSGVSSYAMRLEELQTAISSGAGTSTAVESARTAAQMLSTLIGL